MQTSNAKEKSVPFVRTSYRFDSSQALIQFLTEGTPHRIPAGRLKSFEINGLTCSLWLWAVNCSAVALSFGWEEQFNSPSEQVQVVNRPSLSFNLNRCAN